MIIGLFSIETSEQFSCNEIVRNLVTSYRIALHGKDLEFLNFSRSHSEKQLIDLSENILMMNPEVIIFIDHQPHPGNLLSLLLPRLNRETKIIIHTFGDFIRPSPEMWGGLDLSLRQAKIHFISASSRQKKFLDQFMIDDKNHDVLPFPVNENYFFFNPEDRKKCRDHFKVSEDTFVWTYAGRMSEQKNVISLLNLFAQFKDETNKTDKLWLSGPFDKVGIPYLNLSQMDHEYYYHFHRAISELPEWIQKDISYLGNNSISSLSKILQASDAFISLSSHNDEDYGMALAEALMTGLPCVVSLWGGYADFADYAKVPQTVSYVPFEFKNGRLFSDEKQLILHMKNIKKLSLDDRISVVSKLSLGTRSVAGQILNLLEKKVSYFQGFSPEFYEFCLKWNAGHAYLGGNLKFNDYYWKVYAPYFN